MPQLTCIIIVVTTNNGDLVLGMIHEETGTVIVLKAYVLRLQDLAMTGGQRAFLLAHHMRACEMTHSTLYALLAFLRGLRRGDYRRAHRPAVFRCGRSEVRLARLGRPGGFDFRKAGYRRRVTERQPRQGRDCERSGRRGRIRTSDLYHVKVAL